MTAVANLLARKEGLLKRLENGMSDADRNEIERQLAQIDTALDLLETLSIHTDDKKS